MVQPVNDTINLIAQTLLHVGERVLRVSNEGTVTHDWHKESSEHSCVGHKLGTDSSDAVLATCTADIQRAIAEGIDISAPYQRAGGDMLNTYNVRIMRMAADPDAVFVTAENNSALVEDKWKLALDASADGMWDMNMETRKVSFSDKWHSSFGNIINAISDTDEWTASIHPDDLKISQQRIQAYLSGNLSHYSCQLRYLCKNGSYKWIHSMGVVVSKAADGTPLRAIGTHRDIDSEKMAEQTLYDTTQLLSILIDNLQDGILVADDEPGILFANQAFCDVYDITEKPDALKGTLISESIVARSLKAKYPERFAKRTADIHLARQLVLNDEIELQNGKTYVRDYIPISFANGTMGEIWKLRDITEQKNAQKKFDEQRLFYERILNSLPADMAVHSPEHRFLFVNPSAVKDAELRKWLIGKTHRDYCAYRNLPLTIAEYREEKFRAVVETGEPHEFVEKLTNKEGITSYHLRRLWPVYNDQSNALELMIVYGANITERILAEQELKKSRDTFASAFNFSGTGMALLTPEGRWLEVNSALCDMTGYSKEELQQITYQDITYPADLSIDDEAINKLLNKKATSCTYEKRYISKSNKIIWILLSVSLVWNEADDPDFFVAQITDITRMKELQAELGRKNAELETAKISLVNKVKQLDELSHIIAHNLRGPAGNIRMLSEPGEDTFDELGTEMTLSLIHQSSVSLIESLDTFMEMSQIKLNQDIPFDNCDIADMVVNIVNQLHGAIFEKGAEIETELEVTHIHYPKAYLESILYNFISNAIKYSSPGRPPRIVISTRIENDKPVLSVKDNGLGLDMEKYGHKMFQLNQVFHPGHDSKGIGLFITKTQVESLGGNISINSEPDKGSEFVVVL